MKKIGAVLLAAALTASILPTALADSPAPVDYTDTLTKSAYGGTGTWWDHSDAEVTEKDGYITIKNADNNASYSAVDVANAALSDDYANYTADDYAALFDTGVNVQQLVRDHLSPNVRTLGKTNHGLFSNKITVTGQSTKIRFTAQFAEAGAFVEVSNSTGYGPYINTDAGKITVNTGYSNAVLLEAFDPAAWYTFELILHDGRDNNPVSSGSITSYSEDGTLLGRADDLQLHYSTVEWYKVNFFPNSKYNAEMSLKDFTVEAYGTTPAATQRPAKTPYPTLEPTPAPTPAPPGAATPKPTLDPQPVEGAISKNNYTFHDDFEPYINNTGTEPSTKNFTNFGLTATLENSEGNNKFVTLTNGATGTRYYATANNTTTLIGTKSVTQLKVKFNKLAANDNGVVAMLDLTSSSADNQKSDDTNLVIAARVNVDTSGAVTVGEAPLGTVATSKWYTLKVVSDIAAKKNDIYLYDSNGLCGSVQNSDFYNPAANGIKNIRFNLRRGGGNISLDDVYLYELNDSTETVFEDVPESDAPTINYLATLGIATQKGIKITALYASDNTLKHVLFDDNDITASEGEYIKTFIWNSVLGMSPVSGTNFMGDQIISAAEMNKMILLASETEPDLSGEITREKLYTKLVDIYKTRSGDDSPVSSELNFSDKASITDTLGIGTAVSLGLTPVTSGSFDPGKQVTRYEAAQSVSRLISAINVGITNKIVPVPPEEIIIPHVIDQLPETGVMRDPMVLNAPDGYYYMCCSTGTPPEHAGPGSFPREDTSDENLWKDDTGIRIWRSKDLVDWTPVQTAKEDSLYPDYIWNVYEGGTWEKVNGFGVKNINVDPATGIGAKRFAQVLWAPEIHWVKGTYFIVYCMNPGGTAIARSVSGKPEGPYVRQESCQDVMFKNRIDASMFWDDDNEVYYTDGSCAIWHMNDDMTAIKRKSDGNEEYISAQAPGKEGGFLFKHNGIYYATAGEFDENGGYDAVVGMNKTGKCLANKEYKEVHWLYTLGHNGYFEDNDGNWWATMFGNDNDKLANATNGFNNGFALVPIDFDQYTGKIIIDTERLTAWTDLLQQRGYQFAK